MSPYLFKFEGFQIKRQGSGEWIKGSGELDWCHELYAVFSCNYPRLARIHLDEILADKRHRLVNACGFPMDGRIGDGAWLKARIAAYEAALAEEYLCIEIFPCENLFS